MSIVRKELPRIFPELSAKSYSTTMDGKVKSDDQEICVDVVKFEPTTNDNGEESKYETVIVSEEGDSPNQPMYRGDQDATVATTPKLTSQSSELIRIFGTSTAHPVDIDGNPILQAGSLASQFCPLGPKERCTPSQAQAMGEQILGLMAVHENNNTPLPFELQNTFDIFHRCLAVAYGTFFLNLYTKANAPCVLCHGCKSLYPPGQYIHHSCLALPPNIVPCRSRMWRRCLVPLMSQDMEKSNQKERWKYVLEKFSHATMGVGKRNSNQFGSEPHVLEIPECKRGKFTADHSSEKSKSSKTAKNSEDNLGDVNASAASKTVIVKQYSSNSPKQSIVAADDDFMFVSDDELSNDVGGTSKALSIIKELVREVSKLEHELAETKEKLKKSQDLMKAVTSGDSLSEKFVQSLLAQEKVTVEKKEVTMKLQMEEERSAKLEKQLNRIQLLHLEMQNQFQI